MTGTTVSGAELKVRLTGLGLTPVWFAERLQVTPRTVVRWFTVDAIPRYAATELEVLSKVTDVAIHQMMETIDWPGGVIHTQRTDADAPDVQKMNTLPAAWHRALTFRALNALRSTGAAVTVAYMPRQAS